MWGSGRAEGRACVRACVWFLVCGALQCMCLRGPGLAWARHRAGGQAGWLAGRRAALTVAVGGRQQQALGAFQSGSHRLRPYHPERARSRLISEAKQGRAWLVLGWETAWEYRVL